MPITKVSRCKTEPDAIDEIVADGVSVHIERMSDGHYWMRVGEQTFQISTLKRGRCIITADK